MEFSHRSVLLAEAVDALGVKPGGTYVDCTLGGGGHSEEILRRLSGSGGKLVGIDRDGEAIDAAAERLRPYGGMFVPVRAAFDEIAEVLRSLGIDGVDGVLYDLGVSSHQLDDSSRGFAYRMDSPLDMRMDTRQSLTAADVVNTYSEAEIADILFRYGEEKCSRQIAKAIVRERSVKPFSTTGELAEVIRGAMPGRMRRDQHPAKRSFQALRIAVNGELDRLERSLEAACAALRPGGRLAVITFHSLEDRIVKRFIADKSRGCTCPPEFPVCVCGNRPILRQAARRPVLPGGAEQEENPRSRSAKLRSAEKCAE